MKPLYRIEYHFIKTYRVDYTYLNKQDSPVSLWLSLPADSMTQRNIRILQQTAPKELNLLPTGNQLAYYELLPGENVAFSCLFDSYETRLVPFDPNNNKDNKAEVPELTEDERLFYLRSTPLVPLTDEIRQEAIRIVGDSKEPIEQARKLFFHLVQHYKYIYPPKERGASAMRRNQRGDCGEFSFLFAAYCRSLHIPCRTVFGSWATGRLRAHAWNEFFVEGVGWVPVDASVQVSMKSQWNKLAFVTGYGARNTKHYYFGNLEGKRIVFSLDPNVPLFPPFPEGSQLAATSQEQLLNIGEEMFAWGFQAQYGTAPYLQPAYTQFTSPVAPGPTTEDYLGSWHVKETGLIQALSLKLKYAAFIASMLCWGTYYVLSWTFAKLEWLNLFSTLCYCLFLLVSILRKEAYYVMYILFGLMLLSALRGLSLFVK
ncbi:Transglutaminase-like enzyme, putative cysteine protease [Paenibacillus tianmuensis]|uniref:Transglutaminase-like enzyme, putative cysteine protease n=1 Tax=Paenibacillus tianmuensis TaxID=624147 RepID=A0A1G4SQT6_9BACL|nr:transglutaminase domain-containing protein [Paenibacillus tianmuensis]SCW71584.1 Transglutaminase-like enzyme, putative cysteine protease [Paenibacillus tianmuensis]